MTTQHYGRPTSQRLSGVRYGNQKGLEQPLTRQEFQQMSRSDYLFKNGARPTMYSQFSL